MKKITAIFRLVFLLPIFAAQFLYGQGRPYEGPEDPPGDIAAEREGFMTGNRVFLYFRNTTELSDWPRPDVSRWPNNADGVKMLDGVALLIGARVYLKNDTIPVTDPVEISIRRDLDTLYFLQTSYREEMDRDPTGTIEWGLYPVFGYFNELNEYPAMSNRPDSWPRNGWPATGYNRKWPGEWNGRFGRGVIYADLETFFVANDAQDQEYLGPEDRVKYYPRPGRIIGDNYPAVTIQKGKPWGGIGIRVEQRGFQWNNPQSRDAIFWEYTIANISAYDLPEVAFGYWVDNAIGGERDDELGYFDKLIDMAYSWDVDGTGRGGLICGTMGFAYLESPGLGYDNLDNDDDGLTDEKRDNFAAQIIGPTEGLTDVNKFLTFYRLKPEDLRPHWDADEDQDWQDGEDRNGDGIYQISEFSGDDVGLDGVGPNELNYTGPDEGECNHKPDFVEGVGCEPNFAVTDVSESDMVGLTAFRLFPVPSHSSEFRWFRGDRSMWELIGQDSLVTYFGSISNLIEVFASGPFPLYKGRTERISMSELHSYDPLNGLNSDTHSAPALFEQKRIVQVIYEKDYRFAQPPLTPTLTATPGDGYVILTWDNAADTKTRDPFLANVNDFEGYKLFRATDKKFSDAEVITDGFGTPILKKPIFQCDLIDGKLGFTNFGLVNGIGYNLGFDTGITHFFIDRTVQNGRTYYYALVAYDYGAPNIGPGIAPSENTTIIELDENEEVRAYGKNVQIVTPRPPAAGYVPPAIAGLADYTAFGSSPVIPEILATGDLKPGHTYKVKFSVDTLQTVSDYPNAFTYTNNGLFIYDVTATNTLVYQETPQKFAYENLVYNDSSGYWHFNTQGPLTTDVFDGLRLTLQEPVEMASFDPRHSGWLKGTAGIRIVPTTIESKLLAWDYDIVFTNNPQAYRTRAITRTMRDENHVRIDRNALLLDQAFSFYVLNKSFTDAAGNYELMDLVVHDRDRNGQFDILVDRVLVGPVTSTGRWVGTAFIMDFPSLTDPSQLPRPDDVYRVTFKRPFAASDSLLFRVQEAGALDRAALRRTMDNIRVVPNPYVMTNEMEPAVANEYLNQRRRLLFTHLPAQCTIRIFTVSGILVNEIRVQNAADNGAVHWDMKSREGLDIAAGMYLYHVKADLTGDEKIGKFAVIK
ncbi:MAG: hypothetical protein ONB48_20030 [candidate division KSB1 bacterium]|nr:hypothetical protein [candidate division KSB1 bacterium]MDZ7276258.1 hypothetical protein [candidate division KSB1 bacterium]MDZ7287936.1 hypothetical protein [candidate division KSB1 bacterium]MDZ7300051.1 hypothetical protein [candidate division KSB1 bacterium]MDZ7351053.1 hypothetical protein [candidate division KSB1 bacterium]